ncbi:hypothetical protein MEBOL_006520 [Melittangium boletus DSM 14713]|uniref:Transposase n=1 Tax=Melittangium boletus DSM 14713 TaxID=1294270 RepID=A0A250IPC8_9BACT|nr:hypothetical protein MEBOL_006520 [Melittangium boletus DSM 14713]
MERRKRRSFNAEFKAKAVRRVRFMRRPLGVSRPGYYAWNSRVQGVVRGEA